MNGSCQDLILLVDDNPANLNVLFDLLQESDYRLAVAKSGERALEIAESCIPNLILLDIQMPGIDGFETCARLKANPVTQDIPIIFMTARTDTLNKVQGLQLGAVDYITKPFLQLEDVLTRITVQLELRKAQLRQIQHTKLIALEQLILGIDHAINEPMGSILENIADLQNRTENVFQLLNLYERHVAILTPDLEKLTASFDQPVVKQDLVERLTSLHADAAQITQLLTSLKNFANKDQETYKATDINAMLDAAVSEHGLTFYEDSLEEEEEHKGWIQVHRTYGELPAIECFPCKLNQAFRTLLKQSVDCLETKFVQSDKALESEIAPRIWIETSFLTDTNQVQILIEDNGSGLSEALRESIFESVPGQQTQGKTQHLDLMLAHAILTEQHPGQIHCEATPDEGTIFKLLLETTGVGSPFSNSFRVPEAKAWTVAWDSVLGF